MSRKRNAPEHIAVTPRPAKSPMAGLSKAGISAIAAAVSAALATGCAGVSDHGAQTLHVQTQYAPLAFPDAPRGGVGPLGAPAVLFVEAANRALDDEPLRLALHLRTEPAPRDRALVQSPLIDVPGDFPTVYEAVAAGEAGGGLNAAIDIAIANGTAFGELLVAGLPFGMEPDEFAAYLYEGGGLKLQQELYDETFNARLIVIPIALTGTQGGGWFAEPLPAPADDSRSAAEAAMRTLCGQDRIVRWPRPAAQIWGEACAAAGVDAAYLGGGTRCLDATAPCPSAENPARTDLNGLAFGGFKPGSPPQRLALLGHVDGYELNMPLTDVMIMREVLGQSAKPLEAADLRPIIGKTPYYYGATWHQALSYVELVVNTNAWNDLSAGQRRKIEDAAQRSFFTTYALSLHVQDRAMAAMVRNGAQIGAWPAGLLTLLREATDRYLDARADALTAKGDASYRRTLDHQRAYIDARKTFFDLGDVTQGRAKLTEQP